jgi:hypothetical protein
MNIGSVPTTPMAMAVASQQLQSTMAAQVAMLRELAESQQQTAQVLTQDGVGQTIDITI